MMRRAASTKPWSSSPPIEGWGAWIAASLLTLLVASMVQRAAWVAQLPNVRTVALFALLLSGGLAKTSVRSAWAVLLIAGAGLLLVTTHAASVLEMEADRWTEVVPQIEAVWRGMSAWSRAVQSAETSSATLPFVVLLLALIWIGIARLGWMLLRHQRPLIALVPLSIGAGLNYYLADVPLWMMTAYAFFALLLLATTGQSTQVSRWRAAGVTFDSDTRARVQMMTSGIIGTLLLLGWLLADTRSLAVARAFVRWEPVQVAEAWLLRSFAGVNSRRQQLEVRAAIETAGVMPQSYLLGNAPELYETVVMRAKIETQGVSFRPNSHWRMLSYDVYTGSGWARSAERISPIRRGQALSGDEDLRVANLVRQQIELTANSRSIKISLGQPQQFDHAVEQHTRLANETVWAGSDQASYTVDSWVSAATSAELNTITQVDLPPTLREHYTALPDSVPQRVTDLAQTLVSPEMTPFQQAQAIETYVRQFPYSLDVQAPPQGRDPVDFFLFEQQTGYCDYYASAMVVLARAVGLPARIGIGYAPSASDADGVQTIYQIDGHSWAEIYFGEYGWIEFEPTAGFGREVDRLNSAEVDGDTRLSDEFGLEDDVEFAPPPIPTQDAPNQDWVRLAMISMVVIFFGLLISRLRQRPLPTVNVQFAMLQQAAIQLALPVDPSQTPAEFYAMWVEALDTRQLNPHVANWFGMTNWQAQLVTLSADIVDAFAALQYGQQSQIGVRNSAELRQLRRILWLLRFT